MEDNGIIQTVAANVRQARKAAGLSQEELALEAAVDRTYISQVERGKRNITIVVLARLAHAMGTTAAKLLGAARKEFQAVGNVGRSDVVNALSNCWVIPCALALYTRWWGDDWAWILSLL